jgi:hypothetical protein
MSQVSDGSGRNPTRSIHRHVTVRHLDSAAIPASLHWEFVEGAVEAGCIQATEAVARAVTASGLLLKSEVEFEASFGVLTSRSQGPLTADGELIPLCNGQKVWVVRCKNVLRVKHGRNGSSAALPFRGNRWLVVHAFTGKCILSADC